MKHTIVQYQGGGYDGCIWEWNFAFYDYAGNFHDLGSSGVFGCDTDKKLKAKLKEENEEYHLYDIDNEESIKEFNNEVNEGLVIYVAGKLGELGFGIDVYCDICGESSFDLIPEGFEGAGGIMIVATEKICEECHAIHSCGKCEEFYDDISDFKEIDGIDLCEYCADELLELVV